VLHACEILFPGSVRARFLAEPNEALVQSDLTGERERDALLLLGLLLADLPREGEETEDRDLDSDLQKVP